MIKRYKYWILVPVISLVSLVVLTGAFHSGGRLFEISKNLEIFVNLFKEINTYYVDEVDPSKIMKTGLDAMLETLDPYTNYISESQVERYRFMSEGKYHGIGALIDVVNNQFVLTEPFESSPAYKAGLRTGDILLEIDGQSLEGKNIDELGVFLRGAPNTSFKARVQRFGVKMPLDFTVTRSDIDIPNVPHYTLVDNDFAYVNLTIFTENAAGNIANAIREMKRENPQFKGIILDLRDNGGGLLREAVSISNLFIPKGEEVVSTKGKVKDWDQSFKTTGNPTYEDTPVVVLVNGQSASASEIVSGVMQDLDRGVLIGQRTFGKGLVQNTKEIGYNSRVKITTAKYYIPSGRCIQSVAYKDGEPIDIPDNERSVFKTRNGRPVLDGGGVTPDIIMTPKKKHPFVKYLFDQYITFDYVTQWASGKDSITDPENFKFTDYADFVKFASKRLEGYESESELLIKELRTSLNGEFSEDFASSDIKSLEKKVKKNIPSELERHRVAIIEEIERDIITRFYYQKGKIKYNLKTDPEVKEAVAVLKDSNRYKKILSAKK
jgi:carboxyl-terminal processing protease